MRWNWLSGPLKLHCHHLWVLLHWMHQNQGVCLFVGFIVVGFFQVFLAVYAGVLTVGSLPESVGRRWRKLHLLVFVVGGLVLLIFTAMLGILNDQAQQESDARGTQAEAELAKSGATIAVISQQTTDGWQSFKDFRNSLNPAKLTKKQNLGLEQTGHLFARAATTAAVAAGQAPLAANLQPSRNPGAAVPPGTSANFARPFDADQRMKFRSAAADANKVIVALQKQAQEAQEVLTGPNGSVTKWLSQHPEAKDSDPLPQEFKWTINSEQTYRPDYSYLNGELSTAFAAFRTCCGADPSALIVEEKFGTFQYGDNVLAPYDQKPVETVGDLKSVKVISHTRNAEGLLQTVASMLMDAANQK